MLKLSLIVNFINDLSGVKSLIIFTNLGVSMKKLSLITCLLSGLTLAACNGGGSSSNSSGSSGGGSGGNTSDTPQPTTYIATIPSGGTLTSVTNLYLASNTTNAPLIFGATNLTTDTTVNFTVQANSASSSKLQAGGTLPTLSPSSCTFTAISPQPCTITMNTSAAPAGSYNVVPSVGASNMTALSVTTQASSSVTLPDGTYNNTQRILDDCQLAPNPTTVSTTISNGQICLMGMCMPNQAIPIPSGADPFNQGGYVSNVAWTGSVLTLNWTPPGCPGLISPVIFTKVSK